MWSNYSVQRELSRRTRSLRPVSKSRSPLLDGSRMVDTLGVGGSRGGAGGQKRLTMRVFTRLANQAQKNAAWFHMNRETMQWLHPGHAQLCALGLQNHLVRDHELRQRFLHDLIQQFAHECDARFASSSSKRKSSSRQHGTAAAPVFSQGLMLGVRWDHVSFSKEELHAMRGFNFSAMIFPDPTVQKKVEQLSHDSLRLHRQLLANRHSPRLPLSLSAFHRVDISERIAQAARARSATSHRGTRFISKSFPRPHRRKSEQLRVLKRLPPPPPSRRLETVAELKTALKLEMSIRKKLRFLFFHTTAVRALYNRFTNFCFIERARTTRQLSTLELGRMWRSVCREGQDAEFNVPFAQPTQPRNSHTETLPLSSKSFTFGSQLYHQYRVHQCFRRVQNESPLPQGVSADGLAVAVTSMHTSVAGMVDEAESVRRFAMLTRLQRSAFFFHHPTRFTKHVRHLAGFDAFYFQKRLEAGYSNIDGTKSDGRDDRAGKRVVMGPLQRNSSRSKEILMEIVRFRTQLKSEWASMQPEEQDRWDEVDESVLQTFPLCRTG